MMYGNTLEEMKRNFVVNTVSYIQQQVISELRVKKEMSGMCQRYGYFITFCIGNN